MSTVVFTQLLFLLGASVAIIYLFHRLNLPSILGYISVGIGAGFILDHSSVGHLQSIQGLAKFGVVFLLFSIGLQLPIRRLVAMKTAVFVLGGLQVIITTIIAWALASLTPLGTAAAFVVGAAVSLSSTALVSKTLSDSKELNTPLGRSTFGALIFQDIMVAPLLIIVTALSVTGTDESVWLNIGWEMIKGAATLIALYLIGHWILSPLFAAIAKTRSSELFMLTALLTALAAASFTEAMGLSKELGAFLAGVLLAGTPYHHQVESDVRPFRDSLLGFFFISVGLMVNLSLLPNIWDTAILFALGLILLKLVLTFVICQSLRLHSTRDSFQISLLLAQGGEFSFVLVTLASQIQIIDAQYDQILLMGLIFSMIASLMLIYGYDKFRHYFPEKLSKDFENSHEDLRDHVIICGFSRTGQQIARILKSEGFQYVAIDFDPTCVNQASLAGENILYGNASRSELLKAAHISSAKALVITFADAQTATTITTAAHKAAAQLPILVRTLDDDKYEHFISLGATEVISESSERSLILGSHLLLLLGVPRYRVIRWSFDTHHGRYAMLKGFFRGDDSDPNETDMSRESLQSFFLPANSYAAGKTLEELNLSQHEVIVTALRRQGIRADDPPADTVLQENDILVLYGRIEAIENAEVKLITGDD